MASTHHACMTGGRVHRSPVTVPAAHLPRGAHDGRTRPGGPHEGTGGGRGEENGGGMLVWMKCVVCVNGEGKRGRVCGSLLPSFITTPRHHRHPLLHHYTYSYIHNTAASPRRRLPHQGRNRPRAGERLGGGGRPLWGALQRGAVCAGPGGGGHRGADAGGQVRCVADMAAASFNERLSVFFLVSRWKRG